jgi:hypothetical protein
VPAPDERGAGQNYAKRGLNHTNHPAKGHGARRRNRIGESEDGGGRKNRAYQGRKEGKKIPIAEDIAVVVGDGVGMQGHSRVTSLVQPPLEQNRG